MSMKPGATTWPEASSVSLPLRLEPTAVMRPFSTATSALTPGAPVPSITVPPRTTRSAVIVLSPLCMWSWAAGAGHRHLGLEDGAVGLLHLQHTEIVGCRSHHEQRAAVAAAEHAGQGNAVVERDAVGDLAALLHPQELTGDRGGGPHRAFGVEADAVGRGADVGEQALVGE